MFTGQRVFFQDGATLRDLSIDCNDYRSGTAVVPMLTATDYLYIASDLPFNHRHFEVVTPNDEATTVNVQIWWANAWHNAVDIIDLTSASVLIPGDPDAEPTPIPDETRICSLAKSGIIQWSTDINKAWDRAEYSENVEGITKVGIYDKYWIRLKWSADLKATTSISFIGQKFSNDDQLISYYPDLANTLLMDSFESGKTDWDEQHFAAAEMIAHQLKNVQALLSPDQIMGWDTYREASCHKVAEVVYQGLGRAYDENRALARKYFDAAMKQTLTAIDRNGNGRLELNEKWTQNVGFMRR